MNMTLEKLKDIRNKTKNDIKLRLMFDANLKLEPKQKTEILVCGSKGCTSCKSLEIIDKFNKILKQKKLDKIAKAGPVGCFSMCAEGPIILFMPQNILYTHVNFEDVENIVEQHIINGEIIEKHLHKNADGTKAVYFNEVDFFKKQKFIILKDLRVINPDHIEDYIAMDGYFGAYKALTKMTSNDIIEEIKKSGLRGRGGAGFPTGNKLAFAAREINKQKYIICNGDEGDPGAFMNRTVLESNPHAVLEGMIINGKAIGATKGIIYVRAEYMFAVERIRHAILEARKIGILGKNIFGSGFDFDIEVSLGAGAFVCGEETALIASAEGKRGEPKTRPPYPAVSGIYGKPTVINNVETLANIGRIIRNGAEWFRETGSENSKGTKVFAVSGKIKNTGLVELPIGTPLNVALFDICGGIADGKDFKAVQIGGPSGGCLPKEHLDTPIDYDTLNKLGSMMGSGGMIVVDEDTCMVDFAKFFLGFTCDESCGKCTPCRIGNRRLLELLTKISEGKGELSDIDKLEELSNHIKATSLCGLGQTSPNPILSTLRYFKDEYIEHIVNKRCPAKVCKELISYKITDKCIGCSMCKRGCPTSCISGELKGKHKIDDSKCIRCGLCMSRCPVHAIVKEDRYGKR